MQIQIDEEQAPSCKRVFQQYPPKTAAKTTMGVPVDTLRRGFNVGVNGTIPVNNIALPVELQAKAGAQVDQRYNLLIVTLQNPLEALIAARAETVRLGFPVLFEHRDFRMITATVSVFGYRSDKTLSGGGSGQVRVPGASGAVNIEAGYSEDIHQVTTIDQPTVIAYRLAGICWHDGQPASLFMDLPGIGKARPRGCYTLAESRRRQ